MILADVSPASHGYSQREGAGAIRLFGCSVIRFRARLAQLYANYLSSRETEQPMNRACLLRACATIRLHGLLARNRRRNRRYAGAAGGPGRPGAACLHGAARRRAHGAAAVGRAASRELVGCRAAGGSRRAGRSPDFRQRHSRHRIVGPDARPGDSGRVQQGNPAGAHLVRSAQPAASGSDQPNCRQRRRRCATPRIRC